MKKAMLIETLEAIRDNTYEVACTAREDGDINWFNNLMHEVLALGEAIDMLKDAGYAKKVRAIYFKESA